MISPDKVKHLQAGALVAFASLMFGLLVVGTGVSPEVLPALVAWGGIVAGLSKEGADYADNLQAHAQVHEVSAWDVIATAVPGVLLAFLVEFILWRLFP